MIIVPIVMFSEKDAGPKPGGSAPRTSHYVDSWVCK